MLYFYVYVTENIETNEFYIGSRAVDKDPLIHPDNYLGSGKRLIKAIKELGRDKFQKIVLEVYESIEDAHNRERDLIMKNLGHKLCYNMIPTCSIGTYGQESTSFNAKEARSRHLSAFALICRINLAKKSLSKINENDEFRKQLDCKLEFLPTVLDNENLKIRRSLGCILDVPNNKGYYLSKDFICNASVIKQTPSVGTVIGKNWEIIGAWITNRGYIKGYKLKCIICECECEFIGVREARKSRCKPCNH